MEIAHFDFKWEQRGVIIILDTGTITSIEFRGASATTHFGNNIYSIYTQCQWEDFTMSRSEYTQQSIN